MSLIDYLWMIRSTAADLKTPEGRAGLEQTLENDTATIANAIVQKHYRSILRSKLWELSRESTRPVNKNTKSTKSIKTPLPPSAPLRPRAVFSESDMAYCLFSILIRFPTLLMTLEHDLMTQNITKPHDQHIRTLFLQALNQHQFTDSPAIQEFLKQSLSLDDIQTLLNNNNIPVRPDMNEDDALEFWHNLKKTRLQHHLLHDQKNLSKNIFDEDSFKQLQNMHKAKKSPDE
jgi:DNA primase